MFKFIASFLNSSSSSHSSPGSNASERRKTFAGDLEAFLNRCINQNMSIRAAHTNLNQLIKDNKRSGILFQSRLTYEDISQSILVLERMLPQNTNLPFKYLFLVLRLMFLFETYNNKPLSTFIIFIIYLLMI